MAGLDRWWAATPLVKYRTGAVLSDADGSAHACAGRPGDEWSVHPPTMLLDARVYLLGTMAFSRTYDLSTDDSRFLFVKPDPLEQGAMSRIIVVQNWFEELKRRVPP